MKKMPKQMFDEIVNMSRTYWENGGDEILTERIYLARKVEEITGVGWLSILDFVDSIIRYSGFLPNAENDEIYGALRVIGWEVVEDV